MRKFAIINIHNSVDINKNLIEKLPKDVEICVFSKTIHETINNNLKYIKIPQEIQKSNSKIKNFVSKHFFSENFNGFLHVIEDSVEILKDTQVFLDEIEKMMTMLDQKSWFNTVTDPCNYTFKIYNPRFSVSLDEPNIQSKYDKTIYWTSHANTSWICYDYSKIDFNDIAFDESFDIPMFYIIKFLAERRNRKQSGELYYMNFYPTIREEIGVFRNISIKDDTSENSNEDMQREGTIFESMHINHEADMQVETVMDDIYDLLENKS